MQRSRLLAFTLHNEICFDMTEGSDNEHLPKNRHAILAAPGTLQVLYRKTTRLATPYEASVHQPPPRGELG